MPFATEIWPRTFPPMETSYPEGKSPLISPSQNSRKQVRDAIQLGVRWRETYPPTAARGIDAQQLYNQAMRWHREGRPMLVQPYTMRRTRNQISGGPPAGSTGTVPSITTGTTTMTLTGFSPTTGTLKAGDYISIAEFPYVLWIRTDATITGGVVTIVFDPPIFEGTLPVAGVTATLNDPFPCYIITPPLMPRTITPGPEFFGGFELEFEEAVPSIQETLLVP